MNKMGIRGISGALAFVAASAFVAGAASPVAAATDPVVQGADAAPAAKQEDKTRKYCVKVQPTGRLITSKVCRTREEWIKKTGVDPVKR